MELKNEEGLAKILLIEDDAGLRDLYEKRLNIICESDIIGTGFGMDGLEQVDESYDLVILDWQLPDTTGRTVLNKLSTQYPSIPVVVNSGKTYPDKVEELPCEEYLVKPITQEEWKAVLERLDIMD
jgi:DNA-binding response OmpR family regulator